jgi:hypothetical protein
VRGDKTQDAPNSDELLAGTFWLSRGDRDSCRHTKNACLHLSLLHDLVRLRQTLAKIAAIIAKISKQFLFMS